MFCYSKSSTRNGTLLKRQQQECSFEVGLGVDYTASVQATASIINRYRCSREQQTVTTATETSTMSSSITCVQAIFLMCSVPFTTTTVVAVVWDALRARGFSVSNQDLPFGCQRLPRRYRYLQRVCRQQPPQERCHDAYT